MGVAKFKDPSTGKFIKQKVSYIEKVHVGADEPTDPNCNVWIKEVDETSDEYMPSKGEVAEMIAEGTSADSNMLGGKSADSYALQSNVDTIQTTHILNLKTSGWYRVAEFASSSLTALRGSGSNCCKLIIKRAYGTSKPEYHELELTSSYINDQTIKSLSSKCGVQCFTKARYVIDETNLKAYLELYYNVSTDNRVQISVSNSKVFELHWKTITPTLTEETVDGCTITCTYDIPSSVETLTNVDGYSLNSSPRILASGTDLDTVLTGGRYQSETNLNNYVNYPIYTLNWFTLLVEVKSVNLIEQTMTLLNTNNDVFQRHYYKGTWTNWERTARVSNISNPNLLINGDFRVNQRNGYYTPIGISYYNDSACTDLAGTTQVLNNVTYINDTCCQYANGQYSKTSDCKKGYVGGGYGLDCWREVTGNGTVTVNADGTITLTAVNGTIYFAQKFENGKDFVGKTLTWSFMEAEGTLYNRSFTLPSSFSTSATSYGNTNCKEGIYTRIEASTTVFQYVIEVRTGYSITLKYAKLELGNVATPLSPRPYGEELLNCMRYHEYIGNTLNQSARCYAIDTNTIKFILPFRVKKRTAPTVTLKNVSVLSHGSTQSGFTITVLSADTEFVSIVATKTSHGLTDCGSLALNGVLYASAEL